jgi:hypothetical protein
MSAHGRGRHRSLQTFDLFLGNVEVKATGNDLNLLAGMAAAGAGTKKVARVALGVGTGNGGIFAWANPEAGAIVVDRLTLDVTTVAAGACSVSVGQAANGTSSGANLIDTLDVHAATGTFDNLANPGAGGKMLQRVAAGAFVTGTKASGAPAGLVGNAYIEYLLM